MEKYTVTEFTKRIKEILKGTFPNIISVTGEVSNLSKASSGHIYFILKDSGAQLRTAYFKWYMATDSFIPKNGDKVQVMGEVSLYEADGSYQLIVKKIIHDSVGEFWQKYEETKRRLEQEGFFDLNRKKHIPGYPSKVAVVTSTHGAAIKDFIVTSHKHKAKYDVEIWGVPVQGAEAAVKIIDAIKKAGSLTDRYDVLIVMRGGGSLEDLAVFNDEGVARAVAGAKVPTVSAIGHERDITIIDHVADYRAATPTAAAAKLSEGYLMAGGRLLYLIERVEENMRNYIQNLYQRLDYIQIRVEKSSPYFVLKGYESRLSSIKKDLKFLITEKLTHLKNLLYSAERVLDSSNPLKTLDLMKTKLDSFDKILKSSALSAINLNKIKRDALEEKLKVLNPDNVLNRGYALVSKNNKIITSITDVDMKENIEIKLKDGYINSFVISKKLETYNEQNTNNA